MNAIAQVSAAPVTGPKLDNRRVLAGVVDLLIVAAGGALVLLAGDSLTGTRQGALAAVILGWALYYFFALESGDGQTVGKKLMKLRVVRTDGSPVGMREVAVRTVLRVVDNYLVGLIVMLATGDKRQRIGDLAAGTIIVDASAPAAPMAQPAEEAVEAVEAVDADESEAEAEEAEETVAAPSATKTITLPSRPAKPATLEDLVEDEPPAEEQAADQPAAEEVEPVVEVEPAVEPEPAAEVVPVPVEEPAVDVEPEPAVEVESDPVPDVTSPSLEELAQDVEAAKAEDEPGEDLPQDLPEDDAPMTVKSVETVSAIDLVMGGASEDESESASESESDPDEPASA